MPNENDVFANHFKPGDQFAYLDIDFIVISIESAGAAVGDIRFPNTMNCEYVDNNGVIQKKVFTTDHLSAWAPIPPESDTSNDVYVVVTDDGIVVDMAMFNTSVSGSAFALEEKFIDYVNLYMPQQTLADIDIYLEDGIVTFGDTVIQIYVDE